MEPQTILIVAGEKFTPKIESAGYIIHEASTSEAALQLLQLREDLQLVLCNIQTQGIALLDSISQKHPELPVILFSEYPTTPQAIEAFRHGAFDFLSFPQDDNLLVASVGASLEHGRMRRQSLAYRQNLENLIAERTHKLREAMLNLERSYDVTLEAMGDALDLRDAETEGHSKRVTAYTIALARAMHLSASEIKVVARGAFLHDIGKIAIPDSILLKPGKLTPDETLVMHEHCQFGYDMVRKIPFLAESAEIVYTHQESFDGSGYPRGLKGSAIPLGARIFAIADTMDAITSDRPYRKGRSFTEAITEIHRCQGHQFDPSIVDVFLSLPIDTWTTLRAASDRQLPGRDLFHAIAA